MGNCYSKLEKPPLEQGINQSPAGPAPPAAPATFDLPPELLEKVINKLPALDQVAVSRVSRTFTELALRTTNVLNVKDIPQEHRLGVVQKMCKWKDLTVVGLGNYPATEEEEEGQGQEEVEWSDDDVEPNVADVSFIESVANLNRKIVRLRSRVGEVKLMRTCIESAKKSDASYTRSASFPPLAFKEYKEVTTKYPDLNIKCKLNGQDLEEYDGDNKCDLAVTKLYGYDLFSSDPNLLFRTINVTDLEMAIIPDHKDFKLFPFFDTIAKLPLKRLILAVDEIDEEWWVST